MPGFLDNSFVTSSNGAAYIAGKGVHRNEA
jgi:hypothetical protein